MTKFETEHRRITLLDAPGHRDFIPNMISGAAQVSVKLYMRALTTKADAAILVVDASTGEFEAGFDAQGQTKEHAMLVRSLGVGQLIVAVNKMDMVNHISFSILDSCAVQVGWSQQRYDEIAQKLSAFLVVQAGFKKQKILFVPCCGLSGDNLVKRQPTPASQWYQGPTLKQMLGAQHSN